jgi:hypothetical protein
LYQRKPSFSFAGSTNYSQGHQAKQYYLDDHIVAKVFDFGISKETQNCCTYVSTKPISLLR